jgi:hypothetical protein
MEIVHRTNNIDFLYKHYYNYNLRNFEIDIQPYKNLIILHHDEILLNNNIDNILTLEEFLKHTPNDITINIEIKKYKTYKNIIPDVKKLMQKYINKKYIISSFDKDICNDFIKIGGYEIIYLIGELENYDKTYKNICIHKKFLDILNYHNHEKIYVYGIHNNEFQIEINRYKFITGWIIDYL